MSTRLLQDVDSRAITAQRTYVTVPETLETPANDTVDVTDARLPSHRIGLSRASLRTLLKLADCIIATTIVAGFLILSGTGILSATVSQILPFALIPVVALWGLSISSSYRLLRKNDIIDHVLATAYGSGLPLAALGAFTELVYTSPTAHWVMPTIFLTWLALNLVHAVALILGRQFVRAGWLSENVVIVGATPNARRLIERNAGTHELNIVGIFDDRLSRAPRHLIGAPLLGRLDDLLTWERLPEIDRIVVTVTSDARDRVRDMVERLRVLPQRVVLLLDLDGFDPETESLAEIAHSPAAYVSGQPHDARRATSKRIFDFFFATSMLIVLSPLLALLALAIKLESRGPAIFRQNRHGFNNQIIKVWKFRSMRDDPQAAAIDQCHPGRNVDCRTPSACGWHDHRRTGSSEYCRRLCPPPPSQARHYRLGPDQRVARSRAYQGPGSRARTAGYGICKQIGAMVRSLYHSDDPAPPVG